MILSVTADVALEDVALLDAVVFADDSLSNRAKASLMAELMSSRFFNELRTEKQLGYAVGVSAVSAGDFTGVGMLIQSSVASLEELEGHFDAFRAGFAEHLNDLDDSIFEEAKEGVLVSLREQPQNLAQQAARTRSDWAREQYAFDTRARLIDIIERLNKTDMQGFYADMLERDAHMRVLIQLRGSKFADSDFIDIDGTIQVDDIAEFQTHWLEQR